MRRNNSFKQAVQTWDERFTGPDFLFGTESNAYLAQHCGVRVVGRTAVADGEGRNSIWLARQGLHGDAFDISPVGVAKAATLAREQNVTVDLHVADCDDWNWQPAAFDVVAAIFVQFTGPVMRRRMFAGTSARRPVCLARYGGAQTSAVSLAGLRAVRLIYSPEGNTHESQHWKY